MWGTDVITLTTDDVQKCLEYGAAKRQHYGSRKDNWGLGLREDAAAIGKGGEFAYWRFFLKEGINCPPPDCQIYRNGYTDHGIDFVIGSYSFDVKATQGRLLIAATWDNGNLRSYNCDYFLWAEPQGLLTADSNIPWKYTIRGGICREDVINKELVESAGKHFNYGVSSYSDIYSMQELP